MQCGSIMQRFEEGSVRKRGNLREPRRLDIGREEDWQALHGDVLAEKEGTTVDDGHTGHFEGCLMSMFRRKLSYSSIHLDREASGLPLRRIVNLIHCCPAGLPEQIFRHLSPLQAEGRVLLNPNSGWVAAYGAFLNDDGSHKSAADADVSGAPMPTELVRCVAEDSQFDESYIRGTHHSLGLRTVRSVTEMAERWGFEEAVREQLPKRNMWVVWRPHPTSQNGNERAMQGA
jgi:hypothetical protein